LALGNVPSASSALEECLLFYHRSQSKDSIGAALFAGARIALHQGDTSQAGKLFGAAQSIGAIEDAGWPQPLVDHYRDLEQRLRSALAAEFDTLIEEGSGMGIDAAVAAARDLSG
jgi:hypothetical protein